jgi:hypothetical protein
VEEKNPYKHTRRTQREKRLVEADDEEEEVHYILYQKHIFKVNRKKIIFECEPLLLVRSPSFRVAPIELNLPLLSYVSGFLPFFPLSLTLPAYVLLQ